MKQKTKSNINSLLSKLKVRRKYKDHLFQRVFSSKKDLLDLYNAVNLSSSLNLYEQQSTYNPNMPIRGFMYFAKLYEAHIAEIEANIYGTKLVKLPHSNVVLKCITSTTAITRSFSILARDYMIMLILLLR